MAIPEWPSFPHFHAWAGPEEEGRDIQKWAAYFTVLRELSAFWAREYSAQAPSFSPPPSPPSSLRRCRLLSTVEFRVVVMWLSVGGNSE